MILYQSLTRLALVQVFVDSDCAKRPQIKFIYYFVRIFWARKLVIFHTKRFQLKKYTF